MEQKPKQSTENFIKEIRRKTRRCSSMDILLAESYILDNYNYLVYLN